MLKYQEHKYLDAINYLNMALTIKEHQKTYINEIFSWDYTIYNLLSCCYFYLDIKDIALFYAKKALDYDKENTMLKENYTIIKNAQ